MYCILLLVAAGAAALFYYHCVKPLNYWKDRGVAQGRPIPLLGDSWKVFMQLQNFFQFFQEIYEIGPGQRYCGMYQMTKPTLIIKDPELIKQITVKDFDYFTDRNAWIINPEVDPLIGKNLVLLRGQTWKKMRALLSPFFTGSKMRFMFTMMTETAETFIEYFKNKNEDIIEVEMKDIFTRYTNDVIATTAFGIKVDSLENPENEFYLMGKAATSFKGLKKTLKILGFMIIPYALKMFKITILSRKENKFFIETINDTVSMREQKGSVRPDMINLMLNAKKKTTNADEFTSEFQERDNAPEITNMDIAAQAFVFFLGGFDTVSSFMCFTSYELAVNPDVQNKLREEILQTLSEHKGKLSYDALMKMKYLDMVASESLRKWPVGVVLDRKCTKPYTIEPVSPDEKPVHIKEGDMIWVPTYALHHDPKYFPNPDKFDPERFSDENKDRMEHHAYLPFGSGPRNCIGSRFALLEGKAVLCQILANFEIVPTAKTIIPLELDKSIELKVKGGVNLGLKRFAKYL